MTYNTLKSLEDFISKNISELVASNYI